MKKVAFFLEQKEIFKDILASEQRFFTPKNVEIIPQNFVEKEELFEAVMQDTEIEYIIIFDSFFWGLEENETQFVKDLQGIRKGIKIALYYMEECSEKAREILFARNVTDIYEGNGENFPLEEIVHNFIRNHEKSIEEEYIDEVEVEVDNTGEKNISVIEENVLENDENDNDEIDIDQIAREDELKQEHETKILEVEQENLSMKKALTETKRKIKLEMQKAEEGYAEQLKIAQNEKNKYIKLTTKLAEEKEQGEREIIGLKRQISILEKNKQSQKNTNVLVIGIASLSHGAGATTFALNLANTLADCKRRVGLIAINGSDDLMYASFGKKINLYIAKRNEESEMITKAIKDRCELIILDCGVIYSLDQDGCIDMSGSEYSADKKNARTEYARSMCKVMLCTRAPWHINKINFIDREFAGDENFILAIEDGEMLEEVEILSVSSCNRNFDEIYMWVLSKIE